MSIDLPTVMKKYWDDNTSGHAWPPRSDYYEHYMIWSGLVRPASYLEIGVMYGWSTMAVLLGSPYTIKQVALFDSELYQIPIEEARRRIIEFCIEQGITVPNIDAVKMDTTQVHALGVRQGYDLIHIDGAHGEEAVYHDLQLCAPVANHAIIVDDLSLPGIKAGADRFLAENEGWEAQVHKDHQTHYLMWRK